jgi:hypothetical protein
MAILLLLGQSGAWITPNQPLVFVLLRLPGLGEVMAEIKLERKRSGLPMWLIVVLLLVIAAAVAFFVMNRPRTTAPQNPQTQTTPASTQTLQLVPPDSAAA